jgi:hypothetical protein
LFCNYIIAQVAGNVKDFLKFKWHQYIIPQILEKGHGLKFLKPIEFEKGSFKFIHVRKCPLSPFPRISLDSRGQEGVTIMLRLRHRQPLVCCHYLIRANANGIRKDKEQSIGNVTNEAENVLEEITDRIHFLISFSFTVIIIAY